MKSSLLPVQSADKALKWLKRIVNEDMKVAYVNVRYATVPNKVEVVHEVFVDVAGRHFKIEVAASGKISGYIMSCTPINAKVKA